jgi:hypothetical protein
MILVVFSDDLRMVSFLEALMVSWHGCWLIEEPNLRSFEGKIVNDPEGSCLDIMHHLYTKHIYHVFNAESRVDILEYYF